MTSMKAIQVPVILIIKRIIHLGQAMIKITFSYYLYIQTKHFFMEIINTFKQSIAKIFDGTTVFVSCKTYTAMRYKKTTRRHNI